MSSDQFNSKDRGILLSDNITEVFASLNSTVISLKKCISISKVTC